MNYIRELLAISIFFAGIFLWVMLFIEPFQWIILLFAIASFVVAYWIWPSKKKGQREESNWFLDVMEAIIELPVNIGIGIFRLIGHLFRKGDGADIDF